MPGTLCEHCTAACCRYIALPIDTPEDASDYDDIRWYLMHENISVFVEDGDWFICIQAECRHLRPDHSCAVYQRRPNICRDYSTENCDYHSGDYGWEQHFTCPQHLDEYVRTQTGRRRARRRTGPDGTAKRPRLKAGLRSRAVGRRPHRVEPASNYAAATSDVRGVPLPVLGGE